MNLKKESSSFYNCTLKFPIKTYRRMCTLSKYVKNESRMVTPEEIKVIHPLLNTDEILGGLYVPADGSVDPTGKITHLKTRLCAFIFHD